MKETMDAGEFYTDENGYLVARGVLARTGIQLYRAGEIFTDAPDPMAIVRVYRPHSEVFDKLSMASFENRPVTVNHPAVSVTSENWRQYAVGEVRDVRREGNFMVGTVIVKDKAGIDAIKSGNEELSNGYTNNLDMTPGVTPSGEQYDAVQRQIRGNHVALVKRARCGADCRLTGDDKTEDEIMEKRINELEAEVKTLTDSHAAEVKKLADAHAVELDSLKAEVKKLTDAAAKHADEVKALADSAAGMIDPKQAARLAQEWSGMVADGAKIVPGFTVSGADSMVEYQRGILREAISKDEAKKNMVLAITGGKTVCDSSADVVQSAFRLLASLPEPKPAVKDLGKDFLKSNDAAVAGIGMLHAKLFNL